MNEQSTGMPVRSLQTMLRQIAELDPSIPSVIPDGIYGRDTLAAVSAFQRSYGLPVTGVTDLTTWEAIREASRRARIEIEPAEPLVLRMERLQTIGPGEQNTFLWPVQGVLAGISTCYDDAPQVALTGTNDEQTQHAVRWIQRRSGLPETGAIDRQTWRVISRLFTLAARDGRLDSVTRQERIRTSVAAREREESGSELNAASEAQT